MASKLSEDLRPLFWLELRLDNEVALVIEPFGMEFSLAVSFKRPLHFAEIEHELDLPQGVKYYEHHTSPYPYPSESLEGYACEGTRHFIAGPMRQSRG